MKNRNHSALISRSIISLLLIFSCAALPIITPLRAASISSMASDTQRITLGRDEVKNIEQNGTHFKSLPLRFEPNEGQTDSQVRYIAHSQSGDVYLTPSEMVLCICESLGSSITELSVRPSDSEPAHPMTNSAVVRVQTVNANPNPRITGLDRLPGKTNYFIGNNPKKWHVNIPSYSKVKYENIYPGIDLIYYGNEGNLEYDFIVAPGADPSRIALSVEGAREVVIDEAGDLVLRTAAGEVRQHAPRIYQQDGNERREIAGGYKLLETSPAIQNPKPKIQNQLVAFELASYDAGKPLVIDPEVVFATYFGGSSETVISAIAVDASGSVYVAGHTFSHDFPTKNPLQPTNSHSQGLSAIITKFSPDGASLVYSTYLGGTSFGSDTASGIALDSSGAAYITGNTGSTDFPTLNPIQGSLGGHLFVSKISPDGASLVYSTYLGSSGFDNPKGIKLDSSNNAYVYGWTSSSNYPTRNPTQATFGGMEDGFISVISTDGSQLLFSTYMGGNDRDYLNSLLIDQLTGDLYVSGHTQSSNYAGNNGSPHAFSARLVPSTGTPGTPKQQLMGVHPNNFFVLLYLLTGGSANGGSFDIGQIFIALHYLSESGIEAKGNDAPGVAQQTRVLESYVAGGCVIPPNNTTCTGSAAFVTADANNLSTKSFTNIAERIPPATAAIQDSQGAVYVTGNLSNSSSFPVVNPIQSSGAGRQDAFVTVFAPVTRQIVFSTYLGGSDSDEVRGIALDPQGNIYIAGKTSSPNFPTKNAYQATPPGPGGVMQGQGNSFIVKLSPIAPIQTGPDFSLGFASSTVTATYGKIKVTANINRTSGFTGNVTITPLSLPAGVIMVGESVSTTGDSVKFKLKIKGSAARGSHQLTFAAKDDAGKTRTASFTLVIQ